MKKLLVPIIIAALTFAGGMNLPKFSYNAAIQTSADVAAPVAATETGNQLGISAKAAFLMEANSGKMLFGKDENKRLPIASMTKIMTLAVIYDALEAGQIKLSDEVTVSPNASGMGGSQAFLDFDSVYKVDELIKTIVIASANDSCVALAEHICGSETEFVGKMNELAAKLDMVNTNFVNCTGLPAAGAYSSAADVAKMYSYIMKSPFYGKDHKIWMYDLTHPSGRVTGLTNTNKHSRFYPNCEGGKTGFTAEAGHCISVTAERKNLKPIAVIIGASDSKTRFAESAKLMNYTFDSYENKLVVPKAKPLGTVKLKKAWDAKAKVFASEDFYNLCKKGDKGQPDINVEIKKSVKAPIRKNEAVGTVIVTEDGKVVKEIDIVTGTDIKGLDYWQAVKKVVNKFKV